MLFLHERPFRKKQPLYLLNYQPLIKFKFLVLNAKMKWNKYVIQKGDA